MPQVKQPNTSAVISRKIEPLKYRFNTQGDNFPGNYTYLSFKNGDAHGDTALAAITLIPHNKFIVISSNFKNK